MSRIGIDKSKVGFSESRPVETKKRNKDPEESQKEKKKTPGSETLICLREKAEKDQKFKIDEFDAQKRELEIRKAELEATQNQQNQMFQYLQAGIIKCSCC